MARPRNILLVYKKSLYQIYYLEGRGNPSPARYSEMDIARLKAAHESHQATLTMVQEALRERDLNFRTIYRARQLDYAPHDFVIAVGGDGTLIEAARRVTTQTMLGVNSDPVRSAGFFTATAGEGFGALMDRVLAGRVRTRRLNRMELAVDGEVLEYPAMNDVLVAHMSPAAMSRYELMIGEDREVQRGSGLWISTAAGSTGAALSAGGRSMALGSKRLQYLSREPFVMNGGQYRLVRGQVEPETPLAVRSLMREGMLYVDGPHLRYLLPHGSLLEVRSHPYPLRLVMPPKQGQSA